MGIFDIFKKKNEDNNESNSNRELDRLKEIFTTKDKLLKEKINISMKLFEGDFGNGDSTHLSLLDKLKQVDDEIQNLIFEEDSIVKNSTLDKTRTFKNLSEPLNKDDKPVPDEVWEIFRKKGK